MVASVSIPRLACVVARVPLTASTSAVARPSTVNAPPVFRWFCASRKRVVSVPLFPLPSRSPGLLLSAVLPL